MLNAREYEFPWIQIKVSDQGLGRESQVSTGCGIGHLEWCVSVCWGVGFPWYVWPVVQSGDHSGNQRVRGR